MNHSRGRPCCSEIRRKATSRCWRSLQLCGRRSRWPFGARRWGVDGRRDERLLRRAPPVDRDGQVVGVGTGADFRGHATLRGRSRKPIPMAGRRAGMITLPNRSPVVVKTLDTPEKLQELKLSAAYRERPRGDPVGARRRKDPDLQEKEHRAKAARCATALLLQSQETGSPTECRAHRRAKRRMAKPAAN